MQPRKKSKPNPKAPAADIAIPGEGGVQSSKLLDGSSTAKTEAADKDQPQKTSLQAPEQVLVGNSGTDGRQANIPRGQSWYNRGSWRAKASPTAEVARQSASGVGGATVGVAPERHRRQGTNQSTFKGSTAAGSMPPYLLQGMRQPSRSGPVPASMTILNVTSNSTDEQRQALASPAPSIRKAVPDPSSTIGTEEMENRAEAGKDGAMLSPADGVPEVPPKESEEKPGWRSWWLKTGVDIADIGQDTTKAKATPASQTDSQLPISSRAEVPVRKTEQEPSPDIAAPGNHTGTVDAVATPLEGNAKPLEGNAKADLKPELLLQGPPAMQERARSWFGLWGASQPVNSQITKPDSAVPQPASLDVQPSQVPEAGATSEVNKPLVSPSNSSEPPPQQPGSRSSGWGLWAKGTSPAPHTAISNPSRSEVEAVTVAETPSATKPEPAKVEQTKEAEKLEAARSNKRGRPISLDSREDSSVTHARAVESEQTSTKPMPAPNPRPEASKTNIEAASVKRLQKFKPNLVLPTFRETYQHDRKPSFWQQLGRYFYGTVPAEHHVHIASSPPRIKRAIAIGVHGYFPVAMIQRIIGQPTGTSIRFADGAAAAIKRWTNQHGYDCKVEKVALEGEGMVSDRVDILWKSLLNWVEHIRHADFILIACHSQGVPVAIMLIARLIMFGCVSQAKIGVCAMAGVNLGPFPEYKSRYFGGAAAELFEFSSPASKVSHKYVEALNIALKHGVRIVYIGSIDDQLVSLESATFANVSHPYFYRAVFIDGRIHAPSFLTHLVGFALKLRNLGISDHGLIRELSTSLAGSLYSGEGHSTIYNDPAVFDLAVTHALETTDVNDVSLEVRKYEVPTQANPYFLPWAMRGVIEEEYVRTELKEEMSVLLEEFDDWKPTTKALKDVKFRLEAVKSKL